MAENLDLDLKKPLDKMTAKELRQLAMEKIPQITGASGMDKNELLHAIKGVMGIEDSEEGGSPYKTQIINIKNEIKKLRSEKAALDKKKNKKERKALRRKIHILKKRTRRLANA